MSTSLPDNISPQSPDQSAELHFPKSLWFLRISLGLIALAYAWLVPGKLVLVPYLVFLIGIIVYIALQSLIGLFSLLNRPHPVLLHVATGIDVLAASAALLNDPAPLPPLLLLGLAALLIAAIGQRFQAYTVVLAGGATALLLTVFVRQQLLDAAPDILLATQVALVLAIAALGLIVTAHGDFLRQRASRVTETDPLTGLGNRWTFYEAAKYLLPYHQRNMTPMVVMFAEIEVTRRKGKPVGKSVNQYLLKQFASIVDQRLRASDIAVHYGGNEFAMLLVDTTTKDAENIAFNLQQQFNTWAKQKDLPAYAHIGMAVVPQRPIAMDQILISINAALFRARQYKKGVSGAVFADPEHAR
ncbi:MAG: GGDEF domain-containing protein [Moraxellaceae bacterium]